MAEQTIDLGSAPNDGTGDPLRDGGQVLNQNLFNYTSVSTNYNALPTDYMIEATAALTVTLPTAVGIQYKRYAIHNSTSSSVVNLDTTSSQTISGRTAPIKVYNNETVIVVSNNVNWIIVSIVNPFLSESFGWGNYRDAETSPATQTFDTTPAILQIDGAGGSSDTSKLPLSIRGTGDLWDTTNDLITPITLGDAYALRLDFTVTGETGSPGDIYVQLDIGGGASPSVVIVDRYMAAGRTTPYNVSIGFPIFCGSTFLANGGQFFISVNSGTITVSSRGIFISMIHNGNI